MSMTVLRVFVLVGAVIVGAPAPAQQNPDRGRLEYEKGCIGCHGGDAKGSGVHSPRLKNDPADLTVLAKANGGIFPIEKIYEVIDGRGQFQAHGTREMPIWGKEYTTPEMVSLLDYLNRIQQK